MQSTLPIDACVPDLLGAFAASKNVVLSAPPGAGKTTHVPLVLLNTEWLAGKKLIMLEPRRLAAQRAARYMASQLGEHAGGTVGYRIRGESRVSSATRLEVVTEGVLTRLLQHDPGLTGVGLVIFDEFHERSIHADLGLALTLDTQAHLREDLRVLVMSATLDGLAVTRLLGDVPVVESMGRAYPVETRYLPALHDGPPEPLVARTVLRALRTDEGDILVFLPGRREIRRVESLLLDNGVPDGIRVCVLHGDAPPEVQQKALTPAARGQRKVILSTSIAETSLTIDGVRIVVDAGLSRVPRFDARRGMSGLVTEPVSRAVADQRRGRAGRQAPGICYRLWTESRHNELPAFPVPEILVADLAPLALELTLWGASSGEGLRFIDPPPRAHLSQARALLQILGAIDAKGGLTTRGRRMADFPVHPRLAQMILRGGELELGGMACDLAALLEGRDLLRSTNDIELASRWHLLRQGRGPEGDPLEQVRREAHRLRHIGGIGKQEGDESALGLLLSLAYPERIARRRGAEGNRYQMAGGSGAILPRESLLSREEFLAIGDVDGVGTEVRVFLAAPLSRNDILTAFADRVESAEEAHWSEADQAVIARRVQRLGEMIISEGAIQPGKDVLLAAMIEGVRTMGLDSLPWTRDAQSLRMRSEWLRLGRYAPQPWPDLSEESLIATLPEWLGPFLSGMSRKEHLSRLSMNAILKARFTAHQLRELDRLAPATFTVPTGSRIRLDYPAGNSPILAVRLQEMFGQTNTPLVCGGKVKVQVHLLSPAGRPLAVTQDLKSFWSNVYPEVRRQVRGRYPKHAWPEDPLSARPSRTTRKHPRTT